jgi:hypothetical protein
MPDRLSLRSTMLLVVLAFGLAFAIQAPFGSSSSAAKPSAKQDSPALAVNTPGAEPDLALAAAGTVPALRDPLKPRKRRHKQHSAPKVHKAPKVLPAVTPTPTASPTPTATPRYIPPAPRSTPAPKRKPKPTPTPTPQTSGEFDGAGES